MTVSRKTSADVTISALSTEQNITTITDAGVYELNIDVNALVNGETLILRAYGKVRSGGTERLRHEWWIKHGQYKKFVSCLPLSNVDHLRLTIEQRGGTARTFPTSVYQLDA